MSFHGVVIDVDLCGWETRSRGVGLVLPLSGAGIVGSGEAVVGTERMRVRRRAGLVSAAGNPAPARGRKHEEAWGMTWVFTSG